MVPEDGFSGGPLFRGGEDRSCWQARSGVISCCLDQIDPLPPVWLAPTTEVPICRYVGQLVTENLQKNWLIKLPDNGMQPDQ